MDNLTHSLVGLAASKSGLERLSPATTAVCVLVANAPDADIVSLLLGGRWSFLRYHRAITHSIVGTFALALIIPTVFYLVDVVLAYMRRRSRRIRLRGLLLASLIAGATHPLLDWTNNYGIRLFLPWSSRWFYGDLVFIVDPFLWLVFGGAAFLLTSRSGWQRAAWSILALILTTAVIVIPAGRVSPDTRLMLGSFWLVVIVALGISYRLRLAQRFGCKIALAGFAVVILYCAGLGFLHKQALKEAQIQAGLLSRKGERISQLAAMPTAANPLRWECVAETDLALYRFSVLLTGLKGTSSNAVRYEKPGASEQASIARASQDGRAKAFLGFARFPVTRIVASDCTSQTLVQFADLRYTEPGSSRGTFALEVPIECLGPTAVTIDP